MKKIICILVILSCLIPVFAAESLKLRVFKSETKDVIQGKMIAGQCAFFSVNDIGFEDADFIKLAEDLKDSGFYSAVVYISEDDRAYIIRNKNGKIDIGYGLLDRRTNTFTKRYKTGSVSKDGTISWWEL